MMKKIAVQNNGKTRLEIQKIDLQSAWKISQNYSHTLAKHNAYLNHVCSTTFSSWWEHQIKSSTKSIKNLNSEETSQIWEFVNGVALQMGKTRFVLIPENEYDTPEFRVPQEWIDIPTWTADYYLDVRVNLDAEDEACWMEILGFTTHRQLKVNGTYTASDRTYSVPVNSLIDELDVMAMTLDLNVQAEVLPLPAMSTEEAKSLIEELGKPTLYSPRLRTEIPFEKWAVLLDNKAYRQQLFDLRMGKVAPEAMEKTKPVKNAINLRNWLTNTVDKTLRSLSEFSESWQSYENLLSQNTYSVEFRSIENIQTNLEDDIDNLISLLSPEQPIDCRANAARLLGKVSVGNPQAINALSELLQNDKQLDSNTRVEAILSLRKILGNTSMDLQANYRLIDLGLNLEEFKVALIIATLPIPNGRVEVGISIKSLNNSVKLPPGIKARVLNKTGEPIPGLEIETRSDDRGQGLDDIVEMSTFSFKPGTQFRVQVLFKDIKFSEDFIA